MPMVELKRCTRCIMPETQEAIVFDKENVCGACRQNEVKREEVDWDAKEKELINLIEQYRGKYFYDCIIPFSGGKDSTYVAYTLVKKYKVRPLLVSVDHGFFRPRVLENRIKTTKKLGVDILTFKANWKVVKKLMLESLKRTGDPCWYCHTAVSAYPTQIAIKFNVPLIFWGEPSGEYTSYYNSYDEPEEANEEKFNKVTSLGITTEDMFKFLDGSISMQDLEPFSFPSSKDFRAVNCRSVYLGSYIPWDARKQAEIIRRELDWRWDSIEGIPDSYGYQKLECMICGVRDYLLFIKKGFGRTAHLASIDIRNNQLTREEGLRLAEEYDGRRPASLDWFLDMLEITEEEFMNVALKHVVPPHVFDVDQTKAGKKLWDQDLWDKTK